MLYKLVLGDWSCDGHEKSIDVLFECNYDVHKIRQAYKDSCKKLGITFNHNKDYTGLNLENGDVRMIWTEYDDNLISNAAFNILNGLNCFDGIDYVKCDGGYVIYDFGECAKLIMNFIALSMPEDFIYQLFDLDTETINGYWNDELNEQFGYGLFS